MKKVAGEFKTFLLRGNIMDLAVGIIIGGAFGKIVTSLVNDIIMPVIGKILGNVNFNELKWVLTEAVGEETKEVALRYGAFIQSVVDFVIIGFVIFIMVKAINSFKKKEETKPAAPVAPPRQEILLEEIRDLLKKK